MHLLQTFNKLTLLAYVLARCVILLRLRYCMRQFTDLTRVLCVAC